jgi:hypothetical protein
MPAKLAIVEGQKWAWSIVVLPTTSSPAPVAANKTSTAAKTGRMIEVCTTRVRCAMYRSSSLAGLWGVCRSGASSRNAVTAR